MCNWGLIGRGVLAGVLIAVVVMFLPSAVAQSAPPQSSFWAPPDIDQAAPVAGTPVSCPLDEILDASSKRVQALVDNMQRFGARERVQFDEWDSHGQRHVARKATFRYAAYIHEVAPKQLAVEEYRDSSVADQEFPSKLATTGTAAFAMIFHPNYLKDFTAKCEGLTEWHGHRAWRIHLVQTRGDNFRVYRIANRLFNVMLKARAWIDADTFEVLRLETNLREPIPQIPLKLEHVIVDYGSVEFPKSKLRLWLPQTAEIYMDYRGKRYHHRHTFSNFQLFSVETTQKVEIPKSGEPVARP